MSVTAEDIGKRVQDASGRIGILRDVMRDCEDPGELPGERHKRSVAFLWPEGGGRERLAPSQQVTRAWKLQIARENSVSVPDLLNLLAPRTGWVPPASCVQCATLRKRVRAANRSRNPATALETVKAMRLHKRYGHPNDT
ncbi:hypothetical protein G3I27_16720 [Streptomyces sp. SID10692]|uniref:hypothetical protein n=1 Tax=Streptomyces sp. SID10692 TaxID=2706026 RepID=UPI0013DAAC2C|nr:hypothetical protein [Streptomyces sp. SID10692]